MEVRFGDDYLRVGNEAARDGAGFLLILCVCVVMVFEFGDTALWHLVSSETGRG